MALAIGVRLHLAAAEVVVAADFNDAALEPFAPANYGDGEVQAEVVEGRGPDGSACARIANIGQAAGAAISCGLTYERGHLYTISFQARAQEGTARVSAYLDRGDWRAKFPGGYSTDFEVGEEWTEITYSGVHQQGRGYLANVRCNSPTPVLIDNIVIRRSEARFALNWALAANGGTAAADSLYPQYRPEPLNDGVQVLAGTDFTRRATATEESEAAHWVQVSFPGERPVARVVIYWAVEGDAVYSSQRFEVHALVGAKWLPVAEATEPGPVLVSMIDFDALQATAVRIVQPPGAGPVQRPKLMWVSEVEVY
ncbi:MAG: carbohydrate binding domain-containing protein [Armatimonadota bacterium]